MGTSDTMCLALVYLFNIFVWSEYGVACYHPLLAVPVGINLASGRTKYAIRSSADGAYSEPESILIPCGRCIGCRLERSKHWANRCMLELQYHDSACFLTLTYDNDHVPQVLSPASGLPVLSLRKRDFQLFMKRLRRYVEPKKIRFFACGEYGSKTMRPHYHAIIFGWTPQDAVPYSDSPQGYKYYQSKTLDRIWSHGNVIFGEVSWDTCAYTARYIASKLLGDEGMFYSDNGIEPPFSLCSRKPGIAGQYYDDYPDVFDFDKIYISSDTGSKSISPPPYFFRKLRLTNPEKYDSIKAERRKIADALQRERMSVSGLSNLSQLEVEEQAHALRASSLERRFV